MKNFKSFSYNICDKTESSLRLRLYFKESYPQTSNGVNGKLDNMNKEKKINQPYKKLSKDDIDITREFSRSSGPGGQNVNKVSSKVGIRLRLQDSPRFTEEEKTKIKNKYPNKMTGEGDFIVYSQKYRSQKQNEADALEKAERMINAAFEPIKERMETKTPKAQKEERLREKKLISRKKEMRKKVEFQR